MKKKVFIEGYGCSLNKAETEQITGFLESSGFQIVSKPEKAGTIIINTCAVKEPTENRMLARIKHMKKISKKNSRLIVFGCLPKISPQKISEISNDIVKIGPLLEELAKELGIKETAFSPSVKQRHSSKFVSIIPIARGCLGNCSFCATKNARGSLKSYSPEELKKRFFRETKSPKEIWLTAQDTACYGLDIGTSLPELIREFLKSRKKFRIRIGMMNPHHALSMLEDFLPLFEDRRMYRFFHIPLQSGSDSILKKMNRPYSKKDFFLLVKKIRKKLPGAVISTDIIVGFPGETEKDFHETLEAVKKISPDIINISRFGARPNTAAEKMPLQLHGRAKKARSRILSEIQKKISLEKNKSLIGSVQEIFVSEKGQKGNFVGRAVSYKPIVIEKNLLGRFARARIENAFAGFLSGKIQ